MSLSPIVADALARAGLACELSVPLAKKTYWRAGGPADALITARTVADLAAIQRIAHATNTPVVPIGNASNLLVSDKGIRGIVVMFDDVLTEIAPGADPHLVVAGAGARLVVLLARAKKHGWTGLEWAAGIPGTVGGAIVMNAGSALGECKDALVDVDLVLRDGSTATLDLAALRMSYRRCEIPAGAIVATARFRTTGADAAASEAKVRAFLEKRKATQPLDLPSCGSTFRNPPGDFAGRLIESCGLKGFRIGDAQVSEKHANFVVNLGEARAEDIRAVVDHAPRVVREQTGIELEREVFYLGEW